MEKLPSIALGTWSWGAGFAGGDQVFGNNLGVEELKPVFDEAMANGLNLWDSAVVYGMGASETVLSTFTKNCKREDVFISTKFTPQIAGDTENPVADMLAGSLERFATDYIDIYWIHNPADVEKWTPYLIPLVKSGKVKRIGVSNHNLTQIKRAGGDSLGRRGTYLCRAESLQPVVSFFGKSWYFGLLQGERYRFLVLHGIGTRSVVRENTIHVHPLPAGSQRGETYNPLLPQIEKLVAVMRTVGDKYDITPAQVALAWAIAKGTTPIIGVTKPSQVQDALQATKVTLTADEMKALEETAESTGVDTRGSWEMPMV